MLNCPRFTIRLFFLPLKDIETLQLDKKLNGILYYFLDNDMIPIIKR